MADSVMRQMLFELTFHEIPHDEIMGSLGKHYNLLFIGFRH